MNYPLTDFVTETTRLRGKDHVKVTHVPTGMCLEEDVVLTVKAQILLRQRLIEKIKLKHFAHENS